VGLGATCTPSAINPTSATIDGVLRWIVNVRPRLTMLMATMFTFTADAGQCST